MISGTCWLSEDSYLTGFYYLHKNGHDSHMLYRCFRICSDWTNIHLELLKLIHVFKNKVYSENFINNYFKTFLENKYRIVEKVIAVPKKPCF